MKAQILGKRIKPRVNDKGEVMGYYNELHYVEVKDMRPNSKEEKCEGKKVGFINTGMNLSDVVVGDVYNLDFEIQRFRDETTLRLSDIEALE